ncbi:hypothetical protein GCM10022214_85080 [Actinomadura miaoliensis]|uniref:Uncharacterized protein n=1 Tax=Actinomadura miaoliensis TaxID=430685 RepID=A0ABP7X626_9ACTN
MLVTPPPAPAGASRERGRARARAAPGRPDVIRGHVRRRHPAQRNRSRPRSVGQDDAPARRQEETVASLSDRLKKLADSPQGRKAKEKAEQLARDPKKQEKVRGLLKKVNKKH